MGEHRVIFGKFCGILTYKGQDATVLAKRIMNIIEVVLLFKNTTKYSYFTFSRIKTQQRESIFIGIAYLWHVVSVCLKSEYALSQQIAFFKRVTLPSFPAIISIVDGSFLSNYSYKKYSLSVLARQVILQYAIIWKIKEIC